MPDPKNRDGGGIDLITACDMRYCSANAYFTVKEIDVGMTADVGFQTGQVRADTLVPTVAIVTEAGRPGVLLVGKKNQPTFQPVELGISSGKDTQIISGLKSGTRVFIDLPPWAKKRP